jgi:hypothetical protein
VQITALPLYCSADSPMRHRLPNRLTLALLVLALLQVLSCDHSAPFTTAPTGSGKPLQAGSPLRLTYNLGQDRAPAWLPDESGIVYSYERTDGRDRDRCLGVLPPAGGQRTQELCEVAPAGDDSTNVLTEPAVDASGRLAYVVNSSGVGAQAPVFASLRLASLADPQTARVLVDLPLLKAAQPRWLGRDTLVYLAVRVDYSALCRGCPLDTLETGVAIELLDTSQPTTQPQPLPGTANPSSVAVGAAGIIYYTLNGDTRVFRRVVAAGAGSDAVAFDFGGSGIARDVQVVGSRLVAVVGGNVSFAFDSTLGYTVQRDAGGALHVVDLTSGSDMTLGVPGQVFRRPALAPSGTRVVVEGHAGSATDLWEFVLP